MPYNGKPADDGRVQDLVAATKAKFQTVQSAQISTIRLNGVDHAVANGVVDLGAVASSAGTNGTTASGTATTTVTLSAQPDVSLS